MEARLAVTHLSFVHAAGATFDGWVLTFHRMHEGLIVINRSIPKAAKAFHALAKATEGVKKRLRPPRQSSA